MLFYVFLRFQMVTSVQAAINSVVDQSNSIASQTPSLDVYKVTNVVRVASHWTSVGACIFMGVIGASALLLPCTARKCVRWAYIVLALVLLFIASSGRGASFAG